MIAIRALAPFKRLLSKTEIARVKLLHSLSARIHRNLHNLTNHLISRKFVGKKTENDASALSPWDWGLRYQSSKSLNTMRNCNSVDLASSLHFSLDSSLQ
ncbi:hypothetical protein ABKN59_011243 [Abortiporus biennis]